jgi:phosphohistidine phosphatase
MDMYLLRHAIAVARGTEGYDNDADRPLTTKGEKKMYRIAEGMNSLGLTFDLLLSSPILRARRTAGIVAEVFGLKKKLRFSDNLGTGGDEEDLIRELIGEYGACKALLLVGHEPDMSTLISVLVTGTPECAVTMKKGGLCKLTTDALHYGRCASLEWLMTPRQLTRIS